MRSWRPRWVYRTPWQSSSTAPWSGSTKYCTTQTSHTNRSVGLVVCSGHIFFFLPPLLGLFETSVGKNPEVPWEPVCETSEKKITLNELGFDFGPPWVGDGWNFSVLSVVVYSRSLRTSSAEVPFLKSAAVNIFWSVPYSVRPSVTLNCFYLCLRK